MWSNFYKKKGKKYKIFVSTLVLFHIALFVLLPTITSYALNIPSIRKVVDIFTNNKKVIEKKESSKEITEETVVTITEDGYTFRVAKANLNKESLVITGSISGPELQYNGVESPADVEIVPKDFKEGSTADGGGNKFNGAGDTFTFRVEEYYKEGEVEKFLGKGQDYITLDVMVYMREEEGRAVARSLVEGYEERRDYRVYWQEADKPIKEFKSIQVPFNYLSYTNSESNLKARVD